MYNQTISTLFLQKHLSINANSLVLSKSYILPTKIDSQNIKAFGSAFHAHFGIQTLIVHKISFSTGLL